MNFQVRHPESFEEFLQFEANRTLTHTHPEVFWSTKRCCVVDSARSNSQWLGTFSPSHPPTHINITWAHVATQVCCWRGWEGVGRLWSHCPHFEGFQPPRDIMSALLSFLVVSLAWTTPTWAMDYNLTYSVSLDRDVNLKWGFDIHQENITFELTIRTIGWVSLGFSPQGGMYNADIVMGGYGSNESYFSVRFFFTLN